MATSCPIPAALTCDGDVSDARRLAIRRGGEANRPIAIRATKDGEVIIVFARAECGIYSRLHQGAVPGNLRIENNLVFSENGAAIWIVGPSDEASRFSGPIELIDNRLFAGNSQPAIQGMTDPQLKLKGNFGIGQVVGLNVTPDQWRQSTEPPPQFFPEIKC